MIRKINLHKTSLTGLRKTNEDVEQFRLNLKSPYQYSDPKYAYADFFLICDGHGGKEVAEYVSEILLNELTRKNLVYPLSVLLIKNLYDTIQEKLINHPKRIAKECGTACLVLIRYSTPNKQEYIQVINIGDCRAVLSRGGLASPLTKDHKPYWPDEKKRIDEVNKIYFQEPREIYYDGHDWRIGDLSLSRAFGDLDNTPHVTHNPDIFKYKLEPKDEFIIMACDGLWDVVSNDQAVNFVRDHINNNHIYTYDIPHKYPTTKDLETPNIARKLASYAIANGSGDNVSIMIIFFQN